MDLVQDKLLVVVPRLSTRFHITWQLIVPLLSAGQHVLFGDGPSLLKGHDPFHIVHEQGSFWIEQDAMVVLACRRRLGGRCMQSARHLVGLLWRNLGTFESFLQAGDGWQHLEAIARLFKGVYCLAGLS